jgi:hypothetical protein
MRFLALFFALVCASSAAATAPSTPRDLHAHPVVKPKPPMSPLLEAAMLQHVDVLARVRLADALNHGAIRVGGGVPQGVADTLYCRLTGCTMTGGIVFNGAADDIMSASNQDLTIHSQGAGRILLWSEASQIDITDSLGAIVGELDNSSGRMTLYKTNDTAIGLHSAILRLGNITAAGTVCMGSFGITGTGASGDPLCVTEAGVLTFNATAPKITTSSNQPLIVQPAGTAQVSLRPGASATDEAVFFDRKNGSVGGAIRTNSGVAAAAFQSNGATSAVVRVADGVTNVNLGAGGGASTTSRLVCAANSVSAGSAGTQILCTWGGGLQSDEAVQTATCSAGVISVDPQNAVITIDSNAATCTATITTTSATSINQELLPIRITAKNVGASTLKIAATNFATIPTRCSSTGLSAGQSALIAWSKDQAKWVFLGGCE